MKVRQRPETFADHYSQARQFYVSQTPTEQQHIQAALVFELSRCEIPAIRERMVAHLMNIDDALAGAVAKGPGLRKLPKAAPPAREPITDLPASPSLSILLNGPQRFEGRKLGLLVTDGVDARLLAAVKAAAEKAGGVVECVAPRIAGISDSEGQPVAVNYKLEGGPSVIFDAVAILPGPGGGAWLAQQPPARDFVADAFAHNKFIAYRDDEVMPLFEKAGTAESLDEGCVALAKPADAKAFIATCGGLRFWQRQPPPELA